MWHVPLPYSWEMGILFLDLGFFFKKDKIVGVSGVVWLLFRFASEPCSHCVVCDHVACVYLLWQASSLQPPSPSTHTHHPPPHPNPNPNPNPIQKVNRLIGTTIQVSTLNSSCALQRWDYTVILKAFLSLNKGDRLFGWDFGAVGEHVFGIWTCVEQQEVLHKIRCEGLYMERMEWLPMYGSIVIVIAIAWYGLVYGKVLDARLCCASAGTLLHTLVSTGNGKPLLHVLELEHCLTHCTGI